MDKQIQEIAFSQIRQKLEDFSFTSVQSKIVSQKHSQPYDSPYIEAAAVLAFYDPALIRPVRPAISGLSRKEQKSSHDLLLSHSETAVDTRGYEAGADAVFGVPGEDNSKPQYQHKVLSFLRDEVRNAVLQKLAGEKRMQEALMANGGIAFRSGLPLQKMLTLALCNEIPALTELSPEELNALYRVTGWVKGVEGLSQMPFPKNILRQIEKNEMLATFRHLTGKYEGNRFEELFRGRQKELSALRKYVGVKASSNTVESTGIKPHRTSTSLFPSAKKPLMIFGMGGVGKSTLLAKFILEHIASFEKDPFPFVYLDFDRPQISPLEPETLLIDAARQLAVQYQNLPALADAFLFFYKEWNTVYSVLADDSTTDSIMVYSEESSRQRQTDRLNLQSQFYVLVNQLSATVGSRPFLMILDTFEEVQYKGSECVKAVYGFITGLQARYTKLRVVIAGRTPVPVPEFDTYPIELTSLDAEAAQGYLTKTGITDPAEAKTIASRLGGNPLTLKLAAELVKKHGTEELRKLDIGKLTELQVQGILYKRILEHLRKPQLKKLAHPGMVLRQITPEIILEVLAGPCKLTVKNIAEATALFTDLSLEIALVTQPSKNVLRHRPDVRKVMLQLIQQDRPDTALEIHQLAAAYYSHKEGIVNKAEEIYHRLMLLMPDESPRNLDGYWMEGMQNYLLSSLDELPAKAQAFLLAKAGRESSDTSIWELADTEDRNLHIAKQAANFLNTGRPAIALQLLDENPLADKTGVLATLKARTFSVMGRNNDAGDTAQQALRSYYADQFAPEVITDLQRIIKDSIAANAAGSTTVPKINIQHNEQPDPVTTGSSTETVPEVQTGTEDFISETEKDIPSPHDYEANDESVFTM